MIQNTDIYGYDYYDCISEEQLEVAQNFLTCVLDTIDIWSMLDIAERFSIENFLDEQIKNLERLGLWVFGNRKVNKNNMATTVIEIYSKDNPLIQKAHLDASFITK